VEMAFAGVFVAIALAAIGSHRVATDSARPISHVAFDEINDLPCPWCQSQTREADNHCPTCGQPFG